MLSEFENAPFFLNAMFSLLELSQMNKKGTVPYKPYKN